MIRGSAVNQDGRSNGPSAPSRRSQERVIYAALHDAELMAGDIDAIEGHGTGTVLGDPIELRALLATYGQHREDPIYLGSLKSNVGHMQAAAGIGGMIKMFLAMQNEMLPASLHCETPTSKVDWSTGAVELLSEAVPWPRGERVRRAGVSSFGIIGTNAHIILEEAPLIEDYGGAGGISNPDWLPLIVSARSEAGLRGQCASLARFLEERPETSLKDLAFSLATTRTGLERRFAFSARVAGGVEEVAEVLSAFADNGLPPRGGSMGLADDRPIAMWFTGQGSQRARMGEKLYSAYPTFAQALNTYCKALAPHVTLPSGFSSLQQLMFDPRGEEELARTELQQPALFAFECALAWLWASVGVLPSVVAGHSVGEVIAAHVAGVFGKDDAAKLIAARGALMAKYGTPGGRMAVIGVSEDVVTSALVDGACIAGVNGPHQTVVSGRPAAVEAVVEGLSEYRVRWLTVSHAFHSADMDAMLAEYEKVVETVEFRYPRLQMISGLTGKVADDSVLMAPRYWVSQVREAVRWGDVAATTAKKDLSIVIECGPSAVLSALSGDAFCVSSLQKDREEDAAFSDAMAAVVCAGAAPLALYKEYGGKRIDLPRAAFQRRHSVPEVRAAAASASMLGLEDVTHPIVRARSTFGGAEHSVLFGAMTPGFPRWVADHAIHGRVMYPGVGLLELAWEAIEQSRPPGMSGALRLDELVLQTPLVVPATGVAVQVVVHGSSVLIYGRSSEHEPWVLHATGSWSAGAVEAGSAPQWPPPGAEEVSIEGLYPATATVGYGYGPSFQGLSAVYRNEEGDIWAEAHLPEGVSARGLGVHPALLDSALHAVLAGWDEDSEDENAVVVPFGFAGMTIWSREATSLRIHLARDGAEEPALRGWTLDGTPVLAVESVWSRPVAANQEAATSADSRHLYQVEWVADDRSAASPSQEVVIIQRGAELSALAQAVVASRRKRERPISVWTESELPDPTDTLWIIDWGDPGDAMFAERTHHAVKRGLADLQALLADPPLRMVWLTGGAQAIPGDGGLVDPAHRALWGFARTAMREHPEVSLSLVDARPGASVSAFWNAVGCSEEEVAVRGAQHWVPRLTGMPFGSEREAQSSGSLAVVMGSGALGQLTAAHLVAHYGVTQVVFASRGGAASSAEACEALRALGVERAEGMACDVSDPDSVAALADEVASWGQELGYVVHTAGVLRDGVIMRLTPEAITEVFAPKVNGAVSVVEAFRSRFEGATYLLYSSAAGVVGTAGQANYSAANQFLDGYAERLRAEGEVALSMAWGLWDRGGIQANMSDADRARLARGGARLLTAPIGMALLDRGLGFDHGALLASQIDVAALQRSWDAGQRNPLFSRLVRHRHEVATAVVRPRTSLEWSALIREVVSGVLGSGSARSVPLDRPLVELGVDSLMAVEIRNGLMTISGERLPATLLFDYPTVQDLAAFLLSKGGEVQVEEAVVEEPVVDWDAVRNIPVERLEESGVLGLLQGLLEGDSEKGEDFLDDMEAFLLDLEDEEPA